MTFEDHLELHRLPDGGYDLAGAEEARAKELAASDADMERLAVKAARQERSAWEKRNTAELRKQFTQGTLNLGVLDLKVLVPLGDNVAVELGAMDEGRIRIREDLRTGHHLHEIRAYDAEMTFWRNVRGLLPPGGTVEDVA